jgi:hypothetical protein
MDSWAPVVRHGHVGTGGITMDVNTFSTTGGRFRAGTAGANNAGHGSAGDRWLDAYGEILVPTINTNDIFGIWLRVADSSNYYTCHAVGSGTLTIAKVIAGASTTLLSQAFTTGTISSTAGTFRAEVQGDNLRAFWRGQLIGSATDTAIQTAGFVSMLMRPETFTFNVEVIRFEAGPLAAAYTAGVESAQQAGPSTVRRRLK